MGLHSCHFQFHFLSIEAAITERFSSTAALTVSVIIGFKLKKDKIHDL